MELGPPTVLPLPPHSTTILHQARRVSADLNEQRSSPVFQVQHGFNELLLPVTRSWQSEYGDWESVSSEEVTPDESEERDRSVRQAPRSAGAAHAAAISSPATAATTASTVAAQQPRIDHTAETTVEAAGSSGTIPPISAGTANMNTIAGVVTITAARVSPRIDSNQFSNQRCAGEQEPQSSSAVHPFGVAHNASPSASS
jgi:hypothetical protein